uniref:MRP-S28 domain-containing protein n=1 Tax=Syphacia muris TaxID=451379 RepID=A0A0N5AN87_9BILA
MRTFCSILNRFSVGKRMLSTMFDGRIPLNSVITRVYTEPERHLPVVELILPLKDATWISDELKKSIYENYPHRINSSGQLIVESCKTYSTTLNKADCFDKLRTALLDLNEPSKKSDAILSKRDKVNNAARLKLLKFNERFLKRSVV